MASRFTQALCHTDAMRQHTYTDDPVLAVRGSRTKARHMCTVVILAWLALGFNLAYIKGQFSTSITWVGHEVSVDAQGGR